MGFRIRKSISLGKGLRLNLGKSGVTSVTIGKRGAPHVTVGKGGTRFGTPVIPGTGISYETRLDKPSKKARRKRKPPRSSLGNRRNNRHSSRQKTRKPHGSLNSRPISSNSSPTHTIRTAPPQMQQVRHPFTEVSRAIRRSSIETETE